MSDTDRSGDGRSAPGRPNASRPSDRVVDLARPLLQELASFTGETAVLGIWTGESAVAMLCEEPHGKAGAVDVRIGAPFPADSAQAIAFLASLRDESVVQRAMSSATEEERLRLPRLIEDARQRGYASSGPALPGVTAIAVPVHEGSGGIAATIAIVAASEVLAGPRLDELASALKATADDLSLQLGFVAG